MIGRFQLLMIEPKAFVESWFYIKSLIGFSKGRPVALSPYWKNEINSYLDDIDDTDLLNDLTDHYRDCEGDLFYSLPLKSWFPKKSYCENSNSYKEVDIIVDSAHECPKCLSPDDCKTNKKLHSENYCFGEICANFDGITTFFEPLIKGSNRFLIVDYIFGQKFDAKHTKKAGKIVERRGKKVRKKKGAMGFNT